MSDLDRGGSLVPLANAAGRLAMYLDTSTPVPTERPLTGTAAGPVVVATVTPPVPGGSIVTFADVLILPGFTLPLAVLPANPRRMTVQNTGIPGSLVRIREVGGILGTGILLAYLASITYESAVAQVEGENVGAVPATVAVQFETA